MWRKTSLLVFNSELDSILYMSIQSLASTFPEFLKKATSLVEGRKDFLVGSELYQELFTI